MSAYLLTAAVALASAFIPVVNIEAYLVGLAAVTGDHGGWAVAGLSAAAAAGQMGGKVVFYLAGRGALRLPRRLQVRVHVPAVSAPASGAAEPGDPGEAVDPATAAPADPPAPVGRLARWRGRMEERPLLALAVVGLSAAVGLPPFAVISALAGVVRVPLPAFVLVGLAGRWLRFAAALGVLSALVARIRG